MQQLSSDNVIPLLRAKWRNDAPKNQRGKIIPNHDSAMMALRGDPDIRDVFAFDLMLRAAVMIHEIGRIDTANNRWVTEKDVCDLLEWFQRQDMPGMKLETVRSALNTRAHENAFHPVIDYLMSLQWDGVDRLGSWLTIYLGAELSKYNENIGRMFLVSMVARVISPGCQADHMMVLEGPQGILKSSACRVLGGQWFSDNMPDVNDGVRASQHLRDKWLIEVSEMHAMNRAEATLLKSFISRTVERYRPSYGRMEVSEPRQCVFVGTTNMEQYLRDPTGGRRFWPVKVGVSGRIQLDLLADYRDQLFAEAVECFNAGDRWWPDQSFERELIKPEQSARYAGDIWEDRVEEYLVGKLRVTVPQIAREKLGFVDKELRQEHLVRISSILRDLNWVPKRSGRERYWEKVA